jgi:DNA-binding GntR family transcriptional regulator
MSEAGDIAATLAELMRRYRDAGTSADTVYSALRHAIVQGLLPPGTKLRADELAKQLGISRTPIREAHLKLQAEGLIVVRPGAGLVVQEFSAEEVIEIYHIREALEGKAAALAAENANSYERAGLADLMSDINAATEQQDFALLRRLTGEFHLAICRAAHNKRLYQMLKELQDHFRRFQPSSLTSAERAAEALSEIGAVQQAIDRRDPAAAESGARMHRRRTLELHLQRRSRARER